MRLPSLQLDGVSAGFLVEETLRAISAAFHPGEFVALCGPNGAGKTTLLCAAAGLARLGSGEVRVLGEKMRTANAHRLRRHIGYVPQYFEVDSRFPISGREVVASSRPFCPGRQAKKELSGQIESLAGFLRVSDLLEKPFGQLSGGEKKKMLIARALVQEPSLLFLDEVFSWLDSRSRELVLDLLEKTHRLKGLTTLMVSHDRPVIERLCGRVLALEDGLLVFDGTTTDFHRRGH